MTRSFTSFPVLPPTHLPLLLLLLLISATLPTSSSLSSSSAALFASSSPYLCVPSYPIVVLSSTTTIPLGQQLTVSGPVYSFSTTLLAGASYSLSFAMYYQNSGHPITTGTCSCSYNLTSQLSQSCGSLTSVDPPSLPPSTSTSFYTVSFPSNATNVGVDFSLIFSCNYAYNGQYGFQDWDVTGLNIQMSPIPSVYQTPGLPACPTSPSSTAPPSSTASPVSSSGGSSSMMSSSVLSSSSSSPQAVQSINLNAQAWGILYDGLGHLYISCTTGKAIWQMTTSGTLLQIFTFAFGLSNPKGLAIDSAGALYVADSGNGRVVKFSNNGTTLQIFTTTNPALSGPSGVVVDASFNLWISDTANSRIVQLYPNGTQGVVVTTSNPSLSSPGGLTFDREGSLIIADTVNNRILKRYINGTIITLYSLVIYPQAVAVDGQNNIFIADSNANRVDQISSTGALLNLFTTSSPALRYPTGVTLDNAGNLYVMDGQYNIRVLVFSNAALPAPSSFSSSSLSFSSSPPLSTISTGSLCLLFYSLPSSVDYPFSVSYSLTVSYNSIAVMGSAGKAVTLVPGSGTRTFTNKYGVTLSTPVTLVPSAGALLYLNSSLPVDAVGLTFNLSSSVQLPGADPTVLHSQLSVYASSGTAVEGGSAGFDKLGQAFLSSVSGFTNSTIAASNVNSLSANYAQCSAPITCQSCKTSRSPQTALTNISTTPSDSGNHEVL